MRIADYVRPEGDRRQSGRVKRRLRQRTRADRAVGRQWPRAEPAIRARAHRDVD